MGNTTTDSDNIEKPKIEEKKKIWETQKYFLIKNPWDTTGNGYDITQKIKDDLWKKTSVKNDGKENMFWINLDLYTDAFCDFVYSSYGLNPDWCQSSLEIKNTFYKEEVEEIKPKKKSEVKNVVDELKNLEEENIKENKSEGVLKKSKSKSED